MNKEEQQFLDTLKDIIENGIESNDRTGTGTKFVVGSTFKYDLSGGKIPLWTTRKVPYRNQWWELLWFLNGRTDVKWLQDRNVKIWDSWMKKDGTIGPGYGKQFRNWTAPRSQEEIDTIHEKEYNSWSSWIDSLSTASPLPIKPFDFSWEGSSFEYQYKIRNKSIDQFKNLIEGIKKNKESRRHIISLFNVSDMDDCALPCCHGLTIQFIVEKDKFLHCLYYQRSADLAIGYCPFQYALLTNIVARLTGLEAKSLTATIGNNHVYLNQFDAVREQLSRTPKEFPTLEMNPNIKTIEDVEKSVFEDYKLVNYNPDGFIKFPISI